MTGTDSPAALPLIHQLPVIELTPESRDVRLGWLRRQKIPAGLVKRARAILLLADGLSFTKTCLSMARAEHPRFVFHHPPVHCSKDESIELSAPRVPSGVIWDLAQFPKAEMIAPAIAKESANPNFQALQVKQLL